MTVFLRNTDQVTNLQSTPLLRVNVGIQPHQTTLKGFRHQYMLHVQSLHRDSGKEITVLLKEYTLLLVTGIEVKNSPSHRLASRQVCSPPPFTHKGYRYHGSLSLLLPR